MNEYTRINIEDNYFSIFVYLILLSHDVSYLSYIQNSMLADLKYYMIYLYIVFTMMLAE